jgi:hypothetical protein
MIPFTYRSMRSGDAQHVSGADGGGSGVYTQSLVAFSIDDLIGSLGLPVPTHAKIDVDGPELEVLRGAEQTLGRREWRSLLIEVDATGGDEHERALCSVLERHGFRLRDRHDRGALGAPAYVSFERDVE